jgi:hypothetical protein
MIKVDKVKYLSTIFHSYGLSFKEIASTEYEDLVAHSLDPYAIIIKFISQHKY